MNVVSDFESRGERKTPREKLRKVRKGLNVVPVDSWLKTKQFSVSVSCCLWGTESSRQLRVYEEALMAL